MNADLERDALELARSRGVTGEPDVERDALLLAWEWGTLVAFCSQLVALDAVADELGGERVAAELHRVVRDMAAVVPAVAGAAAEFRAAQLRAWVRRGRRSRPVRDR